MNKIYLFAFVALLSVGLLVSNSYASSSMARSGSMTSNNQKLIGAMVKDPHGETLGVISRVFTEKTDNAEFALVVHRVRNGEGFLVKRYAAVPITALKISEMKSGKLNVVLNTTEKKMEAAPFFDPARIAKVPYDAYVYEYYGVQPSWTENSKTASNWRDYSMRYGE